jgi:hypothetical protein
MDYHANLALQNMRSAGCLTEELVKPQLAGCINVDWWAPDDVGDSNPECTINMVDFQDFSSAAKDVLAVDAYPAARLAILRACPLEASMEHYCTYPSHTSDHIPKLIDSGANPPQPLAATGGCASMSRVHPYGSDGAASMCRFDGPFWGIGVSI